MQGVLFKKGLSGNALKIIALITMTVDHIGYMIFPNTAILRIIGRIAMPIFAFMIAEGCFYTKNRLKYFSFIFGLGVICVFGYLVGERKLYLNILITFCYSILIIYAIDFALRLKNGFAILIPAAAVLFSAFMNIILPKITGNSGWETDYGFFGTLIPAGVYVFKDFRLKLFSLAAGIALTAAAIGTIQWWAFLALPFVAFYSGARGRFNLKYLFYIYYPLHIVVIYGISMLI